MAGPAGPSRPPARSRPPTTTATCAAPSSRRPCAPSRPRAWRRSRCGRSAERLGVSRTALYRHFADKQALLAAVAAEGFRLLRAGLVTAWDKGGRGRPGFEAMGRGLRALRPRPPLALPRDVRERRRCPRTGARRPGSADAFQALVDALVEQQQQGLVRDDPPLLLALHVWSTVHGVAMLALDGQLKADAPPADALIALRHRAAAHRHRGRARLAGGARARPRQRVKARACRIRLQARSPRSRGSWPCTPGRDYTSPGRGCTRRSRTCSTPSSCSLLELPRGRPLGQLALAQDTPGLSG